MVKSGDEISEVYRFLADVVTQPEKEGEMAKFHDVLNEDLCDFIRRQHVFFVATAPVTGRINLSPKGINTFRCLDDSTVAYLDLTGSGNETSAHLLENGRMTIMFCSFDKILDSSAVWPGSCCPRAG